MRNRIGLGQLRNSAAYYLDRVADGESFDVVRRGRLVARIVPLGGPDEPELQTRTQCSDVDGPVRDPDGVGGNELTSTRRKGA